MTAPVRIAGDVRVPLADLDGHTLDALKSRATVLERTKVHHFGRLKDVERAIELWRVEGDDLVLPHGMAHGLRDVLGAIEWDDRTTAPAATFVARLPFRAHQREFATALRRRRCMLATAATGAGKTAAMLAAIERLRGPALVLVPTVDLAVQIATEAQRFLGVEAAIMTGGDLAIGDITIATPETATKHVGPLADAFRVLAVDEVQNFATSRRVSLISSINARYRVGLTATLPTDHRGDILSALFGPVRFAYEVSDGTDAGVLLAPEVIPVHTAFRVEYCGPSDWPGLLSALIADEGRNAQIVDLVSRECAGVPTLVLSQRKAHLATLRDAFRARGLRAELLTGDVPKKERSRVLALARAGELDVLLGSTVADEGLDIPGLGAVVLAFPQRSEPRLMQRIGRVVRAAPGKARPRVFDLVDDVGPLRAQARSRAAVVARTWGAIRRAS